MRRLQSVLGAGLPAAFLVIGLAGPSEATPTPFFNGALTTILATLPPVTTPANTGVSSTVGLSRNAGGAITKLTIPKSLFTTMAFILPVTDPGAAPIKGVQVTQANNTGMFAPSAGHLAGLMPLNGVNKVCLFAGCASQPVANLTVPISPVGSGGNVTVSSLVNITAIGAPWTAGTALVGTVSVKGFTATQPITVPTPMGGTEMINTMTPMGAKGTAIQLVTPIFVSTSIGASAVVPAFSLLNLMVPATPEPGVAAAYGVAIGTLLVLGRRRWRKR